MPSFSHRVWDFLRARSRRRRKLSKTPWSAQLVFEVLEDRSLLSANATGTVVGITFLDANGSGVYTSSDVGLGGVPVTLSGTTTQGGAVNITSNTGANGAFSFSNVTPGTYHLDVGPVAGLLNGSATFGTFGAASSVNETPAITVSGGQTVTEDLGFRGGLDPHFISMREFLTESTPQAFSFGTAGPGQVGVNSRPNNTPIVSAAIANVTVSVNSAPTQIDLASHFSDPDMTNSEVTFNTSDGPVNVEFFDRQAPATVANFFDYINSGAFNNVLFSRLVSGFVLQGGSAAVSSGPNGTSLIPISTLPAVPNEFSTSNTAGTIAMAQSAGDPNSATNQFFFNLANNNASGTTNLDKQFFTVFGKIADSASQAVLNTLASTPTQNESKFTLPNTDLQNVPLKNYTGTNFPTDATPSNLLIINSITVDRRDEFLTYSVVGNSNPALVAPNITNERLSLAYNTGQVGTSTITIQATDRFGAVVDDTFTVTVTPKPPVVNSVAIAPDNASSVTTLTATPNGTDPQGGSITYAYQWLRNGAAVTGATGPTLALSTVPNLIVGDKFTVQVTPSDSTLTGAMFTSGPATIATVTPNVTINQPVVSAVALNPDNLAKTTTLTAAPTATEPGATSIGESYQWLQNGAPVTGATSQTLNLTTQVPTVNVGDSFSVRVTPSDGTITGAPLTSKAVTVATTSPNVTFNVPVVTAVHVVADNPASATTLTATPTSTDPYNGTVTYSYQWQKNGVAITGATAATLSLAPQSPHVGDKFTVQVIPNDGTISGAAFTSTAKTVATISPGITFS